MNVQTSPTQRVAAIRGRLQVIAGALAGIDQAEQARQANVARVQPELDAALTASARPSSDWRRPAARPASATAKASAPSSAAPGWRTNATSSRSSWPATWHPGPASERRPQQRRPVDEGGHQATRPDRAGEDRAGGDRRRADEQRRPCRRRPCPTRITAHRHRRRPVTTPLPRKQPPRPGERWDVSDALPAVVAAGPVTVTAVRAGVVTFSDDRGAVGSFSAGAFQGLYQPAEAPPP